MKFNEALRKVEIHKIYLFAFMLLTIMTASNIVTYIHQVKLMAPSQAISGIVGLIFNGLWVFLFWWLWQNAIPKPQIMASDSDMLNLLKGGDKNAKTI